MAALIVLNPISGQCRFAQSDGGPKPPAAGAGQPVAPRAPEQQEGTSDWAHAKVSKGILTTARWLDSFFYDERFVQEENKTRIKLRLSSFWEEGQEVAYDLGTGIYLAMPGFEDRLALVVSGAEEEDDVIGYRAGGTVPDNKTIQGPQKEDVKLGLRYFIQSAQKRNISAILDFRIRNDTLVFVPALRWRESFPLDSWGLRFTQRFRWYSDTGWELPSTLDLERSLWKVYLFRTSLEGVWSEADEADKGYRYNLNFSLFQPLGVNQAFIYEWINEFQTAPYNRLETIRLKVRYRRRIWRDWLFLEIAPQISYPRDEGFRSTPGVLVFFEAIFGYYDKHH
jgi:hypothetical protein